jgi:hypothetical protein
MKAPPRGHNRFGFILDFSRLQQGERKFRRASRCSCIKFLFSREAQVPSLAAPF